MKQFLIAIIGATLILWIPGCKKKSDTAPVKVNPRFNYGNLDAIILQGPIDFTDSFYTQYLGQANFYRDSISKKWVEAGEVTLNATPFMTQYISYVGKFSGSLQWSVAGSTSVPAINHTTAANIPEYRGPVPDTFFLANGITFHLDQLLMDDADSMIITISNPDFNEVNIRSWTFGTKDQVYISAGEFSYISNRIHAGPGYFGLMLIKYEPLLIGNKLYQFRKMRMRKTRLYIL